MTKKELKQKIDQLKQDNRLHILAQEYHDGETVYTALDTILSNYEKIKDDDTLNTDDGCYVLDEIITEVAENQTPCQNHILAKWFATDLNFVAIDNMIENQDTDILDPKTFDIMTLIRQAYCYSLENNIRDAFNNLIKE